MKWYTKREPYEGMIIFKSRFLWLPKRIGNQSRWLEKATWAEKYIWNGKVGKHWSPVKWINKGDSVKIELSWYSKPESKSRG